MKNKANAQGYIYWNTIHHVRESLLGRGCSLPLMLLILTSRSMLQDWLMGHGGVCSMKPPQKANCFVFMAPLFVWWWRGTVTNAIIVSGANRAGKNEWVSWSFLCWGRGGDSCGWSCNKGFWPACSCCTLHMPEFWLWDEVDGKKGYTAELVSQWFSPVALSKFDWQFSRDREGQTYSCFAFDLVPLWYFWGKVAPWLLPGNIFGKIQPSLLFKK